MQFSEFLLFILSTHAETIKRLSAWMGEKELFELLEEIDEEKLSEKNESSLAKSPLPGSNWFQKATASTGNPYAQIESGVSDLELPEFFEFHLWTYPFYRTLIESEIELDSIIMSEPTKALDQLILLAHEMAQNWVSCLPISPAAAAQAETIAGAPWIRFRAEIYKKIGLNPFRSVSNAGS